MIQSVNHAKFPFLDSPPMPMEDSLESPLFEKAENLAEQSLQRIVDVVDYAEDTYEYLQHIEVRFLTNFEKYLKASVL